MSVRRRKFLGGLAAVGGATLLGVPNGSAQSDDQWPAEPFPRPDIDTRVLPARFKYTQPVIDVHTHFYATEFVDLVVKEGGANGGTITGPNSDGEYTLAGGGYYPFQGGSTFSREMMDLEYMLEMQQWRGRVDKHVLQMTHPMAYWAPPEFELRLSQAQSAGCVRAHNKYPKNFLGTIMLPMRDPKMAVQELERAAKLPGMHGINMAEHIRGTNVGDKSFWPVWERCEALGLPIIFSNLDPIGGDRLVQGGISMINSLGNPFEATVAGMSMILSGALDEFPNLQMMLPHAGGALPWLVWRTDFSMARGAFKHVKQRKASDYLRRFHYDLILSSPKLMRTLIDLVGADRIVCGTDWPRSWVKRPVEYVESIPGITQREAQMILCENPARLLGL